MGEVIRLAEFARRVGVSRQAVNKYVKRGMPKRPDGLVEWESASEWRRMYVGVERSRNHRDAIQQARDSDYEQGADWMAAYICRLAAKAFPAVAAALKLETIPEPLRFEVRVLIASIGILLVDDWLEETVDFNAVGDIDWSPFGDMAEAAEAKQEGFLADFIENTTDVITKGRKE